MRHTKLDTQIKIHLDTTIRDTLLDTNADLDTYTIGDTIRHTQLGT